MSDSFDNNPEIVGKIELIEGTVYIIDKNGVKREAKIDDILLSTDSLDTSNGSVKIVNDSLKSLADEKLPEFIDDATINFDKSQDITKLKSIKINEELFKILKDTFGEELTNYESFIKNYWNLIEEYQKRNLEALAKEQALKDEKIAEEKLAQEKLAEEKEAEEEKVKEEAIQESQLPQEAVIGSESHGDLSKIFGVTNPIGSVTPGVLGADGVGVGLDTRASDFLSPTSHALALIALRGGSRFSSITFSPIDFIDDFRTIDSQLAGDIVKIQNPFPEPLLPDGGGAGGGGGGGGVTPPTVNFINEIVPSFLATLNVNSSNISPSNYDTLKTNINSFETVQTTALSKLSQNTDILKITMPDTAVLFLTPGAGFVDYTLTPGASVVTAGGFTTYTITKQAIENSKTASIVELNKQNIETTELQSLVNKMQILSNNFSLARASFLEVDIINLQDNLRESTIPLFETSLTDPNALILKEYKIALYKDLEDFRDVFKDTTANKNQHIKTNLSEFLIELQTDLASRTSIINAINLSIYSNKLVGYSTTDKDIAYTIETIGSSNSSESYLQAVDAVADGIYLDTSGNVDGKVEVKIEHKLSFIDRSLDTVDIQLDVDVKFIDNGPTSTSESQLVILYIPQQILALPLTLVPAPGWQLSTIDGKSALIRSGNDIDVIDRLNETVIIQIPRSQFNIEIPETSLNFEVEIRSTESIIGDLDILENNQKSTEQLRDSLTFTDKILVKEINGNDLNTKSINTLLQERKADLIEVKTTLELLADNIEFLKEAFLNFGDTQGYNNAVNTLFDDSEIRVKFSQSTAAASTKSNIVGDNGFVIDATDNSYVLTGNNLKTFFNSWYNNGTPIDDLNQIAIRSGIEFSDSDFTVLVTGKVRNTTTVEVQTKTVVVDSVAQGLIPTGDPLGEYVVNPEIKGDINTVKIPFLVRLNPTDIDGSENIVVEIRLPLEKTDGTTTADLDWEITGWANRSETWTKTIDSNTNEAVFTTTINNVGGYIEEIVNITLGTSALGDLREIELAVDPADEVINTTIKAKTLESVSDLEFDTTDNQSSTIQLATSIRLEDLPINTVYRNEAGNEVDTPTEIDFTKGLLTALGLTSTATVADLITALPGLPNNVKIDITFLNSPEHEILASDLIYTTSNDPSGTTVGSVAGNVFTLSNAEIISMLNTYIANSSPTDIINFPELVINYPNYVAGSFEFVTAVITGTGLPALGEQGQVVRLNNSGLTNANNLTIEVNPINSSVTSAGIQLSNLTLIKGFGTSNITLDINGQFLDVDNSETHTISIILPQEVGGENLFGTFGDSWALTNLVSNITTTDNLTATIETVIDGSGSKITTLKISGITQQINAKLTLEFDSAIVEVPIGNSPFNPQFTIIGESKEADLDNSSIVFVNTTELSVAYEPTVLIAESQVDPTKIDIATIMELAQSGSVADIIINKFITPIQNLANPKLVFTLGGDGASGATILDLDGVAIPKVGNVFTLSGAQLQKYIDLDTPINQKIYLFNEQYDHKDFTIEIKAFSGTTFITGLDTTTVQVDAVASGYDQYSESSLSAKLDFNTNVSVNNDDPENPITTRTLGTGTLDINYTFKLADILDDSESHKLVIDLNPLFDPIIEARLNSAISTNPALNTNFISNQEALDALVLQLNIDSSDRIWVLETYPAGSTNAGSFTGRIVSYIPDNSTVEDIAGSIKIDNIDISAFKFIAGSIDIGLSVESIENFNIVGVDYENVTNNIIIEPVKLISVKPNIIYLVENQTNQDVVVPVRSNTLLPLTTLDYNNSDIQSEYYNVNLLDALTVIKSKYDSTNFITDNITQEEFFNNTSIELIFNGITNVELITNELESILNYGIILSNGTGALNEIDISGISIVSENNASKITITSKTLEQLLNLSFIPNTSTPVSQFLLAVFKSQDFIDTGFTLNVNSITDISANSTTNVLSSTVADPTILEFDLAEAMIHLNIGAVAAPNIDVFFENASIQFLLQGIQTGNLIANMGVSEIPINNRGQNEAGLIEITDTNLKALYDSWLNAGSPTSNFMMSIDSDGFVFRNYQIDVNASYIDNSNKKDLINLNESKSQVRIGNNAEGIFAIDVHEAMTFLNEALNKAFETPVENTPEQLLSFLNQATLEFAIEGTDGVVLIPQLGITTGISTTPAQNSSGTVITLTGEALKKIYSAWISQQPNPTEDFPIIFRTAQYNDDDFTIRVNLQQDFLPVTDNSNKYIGDVNFIIVQGETSGNGSLLTTVQEVKYPENDLGQITIRVQDSFLDVDGSEIHKRFIELPTVANGVKLQIDTDNIDWKFDPDIPGRLNYTGTSTNLDETLTFTFLVERVVSNTITPGQDENPPTNIFNASTSGVEVSIGLQVASAEIAEFNTEPTIYSTTSSAIKLVALSIDEYQTGTKVRDGDATVFEAPNSQFVQVSLVPVFEELERILNIRIGSASLPDNPTQTDIDEYIIQLLSVITETDFLQVTFTDYMGTKPIILFDDDNNANNLDISLNSDFAKLNDGIIAANSLTLLFDEYINNRENGTPNPGIENFYIRTAEGNGNDFSFNMILNTQGGTSNIASDVRVLVNEIRESSIDAELTFSTEYNQANNPEDDVLGAMTLNLNYRIINEDLTKAIQIDLRDFLDNGIIDQAKYSNKAPNNNEGDFIFDLAFLDFMRNLTLDSGGQWEFELADLGEKDINNNPILSRTGVLNFIGAAPPLQDLVSVVRIGNIPSTEFFGLEVDDPLFTPNFNTAPVSLIIDNTTITAPTDQTTIALHENQGDTDFNRTFNDLNLTANNLRGIFKVDLTVIMEAFETEIATFEETGTALEQKLAEFFENASLKLIVQGAKNLEILRNVEISGDIITGQENSWSVDSGLTTYILQSTDLRKLYNDYLIESQSRPPVTGQPDFAYNLYLKSETYTDEPFSIKAVGSLIDGVPSTEISNKEVLVAVQGQASGIDETVTKIVVGEPTYTPITEGGPPNFGQITVTITTQFKDPIGEDQRVILRLPKNTTLNFTYDDLAPSAKFEWNDAKDALILKDQPAPGLFNETVILTFNIKEVAREVLNTSNDSSPSYVYNESNFIPSEFILEVTTAEADTKTAQTPYAEPGNFDPFVGNYITDPTTTRNFLLSFFDPTSADTLTDNDILILLILNQMLLTDDLNQVFTNGILNGIAFTAQEKRDLLLGMDNIIDSNGGTFTNADIAALQAQNKLFEPEDIDYVLDEFARVNNLYGREYFSAMTVTGNNRDINGISPTQPVIAATISGGSLPAGDTPNEYLNSAVIDFFSKDVDKNTIEEANDRALLEAVIDINREFLVEFSLVPLFKDIAAFLESAGGIDFNVPNDERDRVLVPLDPRYGNIIPDALVTVIPTPDFNAKPAYLLFQFDGHNIDAGGNPVPVEQHPIVFSADPNINQAMFDFLNTDGYTVADPTVDFTLGSAQLIDLFLRWFNNFDKNTGQEIDPNLDLSLYILPSDKSNEPFTVTATAYLNKSITSNGDLNTAGAVAPEVLIQDLPVFVDDLARTGEFTNIVRAPTSVPDGRLIYAENFTYSSRDSLTDIQRSHDIFATPGSTSAITNSGSLEVTYTPGSNSSPYSYSATTNTASSGIPMVNFDLNIKLEPTYEFGFKIFRLVIETPFENPKPGPGTDNVPGDFNDHITNTILKQMINKAGSDFSGGTIQTEAEDWNLVINPVTNKIDIVYEFINPTTGDAGKPVQNNSNQDIVRNGSYTPADATDILNNVEIPENIDVKLNLSVPQAIMGPLSENLSNFNFTITEFGFVLENDLLTGGNGLHPDDEILFIDPLNAAVISGIFQDLDGIAFKVEGDGDGSNLAVRNDSSENIIYSVNDEPSDDTNAGEGSLKYITMRGGNLNDIIVGEGNIDTYGGDDRIYLIDNAQLFSEEINKNIVVSNGGNNIVYSNSTRGANITLGSGDDTVIVDTFNRIYGDTAITTGSGNDSVQITDGIVNTLKTLNINVGDGDDTVTLTSDNNRQIEINYSDIQSTGTGIELGAPANGKYYKIDLGSGTNTLNINGSSGYFITSNGASMNTITTGTGSYELFLQNGGSGGTSTITTSNNRDKITLSKYKNANVLLNGGDDIGYLNQSSGNTINLGAGNDVIDIKALESTGVNITNYWGDFNFVNMTANFNSFLSGITDVTYSKTNKSQTHTEFTNLFGVKEYYYSIADYTYSENVNINTLFISQDQFTRRNLFFNGTAQTGGKELSPPVLTDQDNLFRFNIPVLGYTPTGSQDGQYHADTFTPIYYIGNNMINITTTSSSMNQEVTTSLEMLNLNKHFWYSQNSNPVPGDPAVTYHYGDFFDDRTRDLYSLSTSNAEINTNTIIAGNGDDRIRGAQGSIINLSGTGQDEVYYKQSDWTNSTSMTTPGKSSKLNVFDVITGFDSDDKITIELDKSFDYNLKSVTATVNGGAATAIFLETNDHYFYNVAVVQGTINVNTQVDFVSAKVDPDFD